MKKNYRFTISAQCSQTYDEYQLKVWLAGDGLDRGDSGQAELLSVTGIGPWTTACYFLFVVGDGDIWPTGDRALYVSMARNLSLDDVPVAAVADAIAKSWSPYRSTAARMLWHDYLGGRGYIEDPNAGFAEETGKVSG